MLFFGRSTFREKKYILYIIFVLFFLIVLGYTLGKIRSNVDREKQIENIVPSNK